MSKELIDIALIIHFAVWFISSVVGVYLYRIGKFPHDFPERYDQEDSISGIIMVGLFWEVVVLMNFIFYLIYCSSTLVIWLFGGGEIFDE